MLPIEPPDLVLADVHPVSRVEKRFLINRVFDDTPDGKQCAKKLDKQMAYQNHVILKLSEVSIRGRK